MIQDVLRARIDEYAPANALEQENVLQEIMQHYVLASLSSAGLFSDALFHGGTCLRVIHGMRRFSQDLDFLLKVPDPAFRWRRYLTQVRKDCDAAGLAFEAVDRTAAGIAVQKAFLKTDSVGHLLSFELPFGRHRHRKIKIKLEIDTNPPAGSSYETAYLMFPRTVPLTVQSLPSGFGTKMHALLCRTYVKGRDWYDFLWYISRSIAPDLNVLANALVQQGPWAGVVTEVSPGWLAEQMEHKIRDIDWRIARDDVQRFLPLSEQDGLAQWGADLFLYHLRRMPRPA